MAQWPLAPMAEALIPSLPFAPENGVESGGAAVETQPDKGVVRGERVSAFTPTIFLPIHLGELCSG